MNLSPKLFATLGITLALTLLLLPGWVIRTRVEPERLRAQRRLNDSENQVRFLERELANRETPPPRDQLEQETARLRREIQQAETLANERHKPRIDSRRIPEFHLRLAREADAIGLHILRHAVRIDITGIPAHEDPPRELELRGRFADTPRFLDRLLALSHRISLTETELAPCPDHPGWVRLRLLYQL